MGYALLAGLCVCAIDARAIRHADPGTTDPILVQRAEALALQARDALRRADPGAARPVGDDPAGRTLTAVLNELKEIEFHLGAQALGDLRPFLQRPVDLRATRTSEHFVIHYAIEGPDRPLAGIVEAAELACERAWDVYHGEMGWPVVAGGIGSDGRLDIFVRDLGWGAYGYALHETEAEGSGESGFVVVDNDFAGYAALPAADAMRVTLAHEVHHLVQFGYGYAAEANWFMEQSATMMEGRVYPDLSDRERFLPFFTANPHRHLDLSNGSFEYGAWLWPQYLVERPGFGTDLLQAVWDVWGSSDLTMIRALDVALVERGSSLAAAHGEWAVWNAFLGRPDPAAHYRGAGSLPCRMSVEASASHYPLESLHPALVRQPERLGASYVALVPDPASAHNRLEVRVEAGADLLGATLICWPASGEAPVAHGVPLTGGRGAIEIAGWNETDEACLVLQVGPEAEAACDYAVTAHTRLASADVGEDPATAPDPLRLVLAPNPFEARTQVTYELPSDSPVSLRIFDAGGRLVVSLVEGLQTAGRHQIEWSGAGGEAAVYFCELRTPSESRRLRVIRLR
jgi:hypothetical protein